MFRLVLRYLLMVTPPLIGVVLLLRVGQGLTPPVSVKGTWTLDLDGTAGSACGELSFRQIPATLTIIQSGPQLQLAMNDANKTVMNGEITANAITAASAKASSIRFEATTDPQPIPGHLTGQVTSTECAAPVSVAFSAVRTKAGEGQ